MDRMQKMLLLLLSSNSAQASYQSTCPSVLNR